MKSHPLIFTAESVRAILEGQKTMTRRILKPQPPNDDPPLTQPEMFNPIVADKHGEEKPGPEIFGVYGDDWHVKINHKPGDLIWVKEAWCHFPDSAPDGMGENTYYKSESGNDNSSGLNVMERNGIKWKSPIFMPRWASRITLNVKAVRIERVQEISEGDCMMEGCPKEFLLGQNWFWPLWNTIHKKKPENQWDANPWVVVIEFKK